MVYNWYQVELAVVSLECNSVSISEVQCFTIHDLPLYVPIHGVGIKY